jgi:predicted enzyme related to lactoylglutathione lyase
MGVHPTGTEGPASGATDISFYCDDIDQTIEQLRGRGVEFTGPVEDHGYGLVTYFMMPGKIKVQLYQPRYSKSARG